jgi:hypothetical protein
MRLSVKCTAVIFHLFLCVIEKSPHTLPPPTLLLSWHLIPWVLALNLGTSVIGHQLRQETRRLIRGCSVNMAGYNQPPDVNRITCNEHNIICQ